MSLSKVIKLPSLLQKLEESGYETLDEVKKECLSSLTKELELNKEEIKVVGKLGAKDNTRKQKIDESLTMEIESSFTTAVKSFDRLFVYGISPKKITEICGESGTGKTQLCMQMAVTIQLPKSQGGSEGECVYIDTEGSFNALRVQKIAERFDLKEPLKGIHVFRVLNYTEFVAIIMQLTEILTSRTRVKLVIIDSIAYHLRVNAFTFRGRIDFLNFTGHHLIKLARNLTVSIVVTNHVTTDGASDTWTPSLGNEWGNWCANRLFLFRKRESRFGHLYKSVEEIGNVESVQFCIKDRGLFDPENDEIIAFKKENNTQPLSSQDQFGASLQEDELEILAFENELKKINQEKIDEGSVLGKRTSEDIIDSIDYLDDYLKEHNSKSMKYGLQINIPSQQTSENTTNDKITNVNTTASNHRINSVLSNTTSHSSNNNAILVHFSQQNYNVHETPNVNNTNTIPNSDLDAVPTIPTINNQNENDNNDEESNIWASDGEEEWDLDFLANIQNYF